VAAGVQPRQPRPSASTWSTGNPCPVAPVLARHSSSAPLARAWRHSSTVNRPCRPVPASPAQALQHLPGQGGLPGGVWPDRHPGDGLGAALGQPDQPDLRERPTPCPGRSPADRTLVGWQGCRPHPGTSPPSLAPAGRDTTRPGLRGRQRPGGLLKQHPQRCRPSRARAWTSADLAGTRQAGHGSRGLGHHAAPAGPRPGSPAPPRRPPRANRANASTSSTTSRAGAAAGAARPGRTRPAPGRPAPAGSSGSASRSRPDPTAAAGKLAWFVGFLASAPHSSKSRRRTLPHQSR
jgi:hypothetical protein